MVCCYRLLPDSWPRRSQSHLRLSFECLHQSGFSFFALRGQDWRRLWAVGVFSCRGFAHELLLPPCWTIAIGMGDAWMSSLRCPPITTYALCSKRSKWNAHLTSYGVTSGFDLLNPWVWLVEASAGSGAEACGRQMRKNFCFSLRALPAVKKCGSCLFFLSALFSGFWDRLFV